jgi:pyruvate formate lyase activating enzyme
MDRRDFLKKAGLIGAGLIVSSLKPMFLFTGLSDSGSHKGLFWASRAAHANEAAHSPDFPANLKPAMYSKVSGKNIICTLCPHECTLSPDAVGRCRVRANYNNKLYSLNYARAAALHIDPIEKKPFYHFFPATRALSVAAPGCNLTCTFCQNWNISQVSVNDIKTETLLPEDLVNRAVSQKCKSLAFTYSDPSVFYEYALDSAIIAKEKGIHPVSITAAYLNKKPFKNILTRLSAIKIDLKAFTEKFYRQVCGASLAPVLESIARAKESCVWLEIVVLLIPGLNDSDQELTKMCKWLKSNTGETTPLHFSRFFPTYKMKNIPPTAPQTLVRAREIAMAQGLKHVYIGNLAGLDASNTFCSKCSQMVIRRQGYKTDILYSQKNNQAICPSCKTPISGIFF